MECESSQLDDYLLVTNEVDYTHVTIQQLASELFQSTQTEVEKTKKAFDYVRDEIGHSWDIREKRVTCRASEVLTYRHGICYAKSNLLAALLRSQGIPTGFCYQRLMLFDTPEKGYCIHALNAVYFASLGKWIRLDARGNKAGIDAQFSVTKEKLAFQVNKELGEIDYPLIYAAPHPKTMAVLEEHADALDMYVNHLPEEL